jgi:hypothetical protein
VVTVFRTSAHLIDPSVQQGHQVVINVPLVPAISQSSNNSIDDLESLVQLPDEQHFPVAGDVAALKVHGEWFMLAVRKHHLSVCAVCHPRVAAMNGSVCVTSIAH